MDLAAEGERRREPQGQRIGEPAPRAEFSRGRGGQVPQAPESLQQIAGPRRALRMEEDRQEVARAEGVGSPEGQAVVDGLDGGRRRR
jgi:hypothetical protein